MSVATILKPQGIRGEVKVQTLVDDVDLLLTIKSFIIGQEKFTVKTARKNGEFCYILFDQVLDRNKAETLRGCELCVDDASKPKLGKGRYYISDVVGMSVVADNEILGKIEDIMQYGSADIYSVKGQQNFMFPAINAVVLEYNIIDKQLLVDKQELLKVAVYED